MTVGCEHVSVPEAAALLDMDGGDVYMLIFEGHLEATPTLERGVLVPVAAIERWKDTHPRAAPGA